jgi:hypothetical protein
MWAMQGFSQAIPRCKVASPAKKNPLKKYSKTNQSAGQPTGALVSQWHSSVNSCKKASRGQFCLSRPEMDWTQAGLFVEIEATELHYDRAQTCQKQRVETGLSMVLRLGNQQLRVALSTTRSPELKRLPVGVEPRLRIRKVRPKRYHYLLLLKRNRGFRIQFLNILMEKSSNALSRLNWGSN